MRSIAQRAAEAGSVRTRGRALCPGGALRIRPSRALASVKGRDESEGSSRLCLACCVRHEWHACCVRHEWHAVPITLGQTLLRRIGPTAQLEARAGCPRTRSFLACAARRCFRVRAFTSLVRADLLTLLVPHSRRYSHLLSCMLRASDLQRRITAKRVGCAENVSVTGFSATATVIRLFTL
eukprot:3558563-Pleurochrysis_carterae.AAC.2